VLPLVVLRIDFGLYLLVVDDDIAEGPTNVGGVEGGPRFPDLMQKLEPFPEVVSKSVVDLL